MIAYKLLREGRVGPFSGVRWPPPGEWLQADDVEACRSGLHACSVDDLPLWLGLGELWEVELEDAVAEERKLVARRARLLRRIEEWDERAGRAFVAACADEARRRGQETPALAGYARDISEEHEPPAMAGYVVARLAELQEGPNGYDAERRRQADWLAARLGLARVSA